MKLFGLKDRLETMVTNYLYPVTGSTPPTLAQGANVNSVVATVYPSSGTDAAVGITHNMNMPASDISQGWPMLEIRGLDSLAGQSGWFLQSVDPNYVGLARLTSNQGEDTVPQIKVIVSRPQTIFR